MRLSALLKGGERRQVTVEDLWPHKSFLILKFERVETISDAEALKGAELQVPRAERAELDPGWTYLSDLIGCSVFEGEGEIGCITDVMFGAGEAPLLVVRSKKHQDAKETSGNLHYEIPFAEAYLVSVDVQHKVVRMRLPDGLLNVNGPVKKEGL